MASAAALNEVAKAMAMLPSNGDEYLKQQGLGYLQCFKLFSTIKADEIPRER